MKRFSIKSIGPKIQTRMGFLILLVLLFWIKTVAIYFLDFSLGIADPLQFTLLLLNPLETTLLLFGLALYIQSTRGYYWTLIIIDILNTVILFANVIYYRQFTDFLTVNTVLGYSKVSQGLGTSSIALLKPTDLICWLDILVIIILIAVHVIKFDKRPIPFKTAVSVSSLAIALLAMNIATAELNRPQLLTRTFDRNYLVKYLGLDSFTVYDSVKTAQNRQVRAQAKSSDMDNVLTYINQHYAAPNSAYFGKAKGKNIIIIHLESFQQFLIDDKLDDEEVTPFLNSLYHNKNTLSYENFFNQVGQGKTSDAENMLETGIFGLPQGSVFSSLGSDNTFQGAPAILEQQAGYSTGVFHGNIGTFWNRNNVYKNLGYQYFFDSSYFDNSEGSSLEYGLKDKLLFAESTKYLEHMQQPFYTKFITVTNHYPFPLTRNDTDFPAADTDDPAINGYFQTAHYLDQSVHEFFNYLKASGLYENSVIVLYGDHYGISNSENPTLAPLLNQDATNWNEYDNVQLQRVPFMIHMPGLKGGIKSTYGGEIDVLPTLLHLAGVNTKGDVQFGTDLLSKDHDQTVIFRNNNFITPNYTVMGNSIYDNQTGEIANLTDEQKKALKNKQKQVNKALSLSDSVNNKNLLRFYTPKNFTPVNPSLYNYLTGYQSMLNIEQQLGDKSTSLYSQNGDKTTTDLYKTDAPELVGKENLLTDVPSRYQTDSGTDNSTSDATSTDMSESTSDANATSQNQ